jgi:hypothetical protein
MARITCGWCGAECTIGAPCPKCGCGGKGPDKPIPPQHEIMRVDVDFRLMADGYGNANSTAEIRVAELTSMPGCAAPDRGTRVAFQAIVHEWIASLPAMLTGLPANVTVVNVPPASRN